MFSKVQTESAWQGFCFPWEHKRTPWLRTSSFQKCWLLVSISLLFSTGSISHGTWSPRSDAVIKTIVPSKITLGRPFVSLTQEYLRKQVDLNYSQPCFQTQPANIPISHRASGRWVQIFKAHGTSSWSPPTWGSQRLGRTQTRDCLVSLRRWVQEER